MKIGLISINFYAKALNSACSIHTWAFQQFLKSNGIDGTVIDYLPEHAVGYDMKYPANTYAARVERQMSRNPLPNQQSKLTRSSEMLTPHCEKNVLPDMKKPENSSGIII